MAKPCNATIMEQHIRLLGLPNITCIQTKRPLPPSDKYWDFQLDSFFSHFSMTPFQISLDLDLDLALKAYQDAQMEGPYFSSPC
uniref:Putative ovule protein n=1 Tax=Solanum chacoense TaxID=4108 RepID=A0A0V0GLS5_SOLCH